MALSDTERAELEKLREENKELVAKATADKAIKQAVKQRVKEDVNVSESESEIGNLNNGAPAQGATGFGAVPRLPEPPAMMKEKWNLWYFLFEAYVAMNLSKKGFEKFRCPELRKFAYVNALTRAAQAGNQLDVLDEIKLYSESGKECEALLAELHKRHGVADRLLKIRAMDKFLGLRRKGNVSLLHAVVEYKKAFVECISAGYLPDAATQMLVLDRVTTVQESMAANAQALVMDKNVKDPEERYDVLYEMGLSCQAQSEGEARDATMLGSAAGAAVLPLSKKKTLYNAHPPAAGDEDVETKGQECDQCGLVHQTGRCPATNQMCTVCKKEGHFRARCPSRKNKAEANAKWARGGGVEFEMGDAC